MNTPSANDNQDGTDLHPKVSVLLKHVTKKNNIGQLVRSCVALGACELAYVSRNTARISNALGSDAKLAPSSNLVKEAEDLADDAQERHATRRPDKPNLFGSHGSASHLPLRHFNNLSAAKQYYQQHKVQIVGVEIHPTALPVHAFPWKPQTVLLMGNEGEGLTQQELDMCDALVYIPQYGNGTASLNVVVAASIVLHSFAVWAKFKESERLDDKFVVVEKKGLSILMGDAKNEHDMRERLRNARRNKSTPSSSKQQQQQEMQVDDTPLETE